MSTRISLPRVLLRVIPAGFIVGACLEVFMIKVTIGKESFYETAVRLEAQRRAARQQELSKAKNPLPDTSLKDMGDETGDNRTG
jgi:hypothetical protein